MILLRVSEHLNTLAFQQVACIVKMVCKEVVFRRGDDCLREDRTNFLHSLIGDLTGILHNVYGGRNEEVRGKVLFSLNGWENDSLWRTSYELCIMNCSMSCIVEDSYLNVLLRVFIFRK
ncbi:hypothetical protein AVEN_143759-1 [Araneus ventricosus]|uniref:Uncharacterized protein n=1 Tax=Araneus ventricosus TaxID=182803 RepID=A0A4Y2ANN2_ARAVE|nr:hypothetical protein AVEN_143759-1 [Araneus ventricosus]